MTSLTLWLVAVGPFALACVGLIPEIVTKAGYIRARLAQAAGALCVLIALAGLVAVFVQGTLTTGTIGLSRIGFALYLDRLSVLMLTLVSFVGLIVISYSRNYLDGDPGQNRFMRWLSLALCSVLLLILSGNLFQFAVAWIATSLSLHRLLLFYNKRPAAILAARKKFIVSRVGDICLLAAIVLIYRQIGTLDQAAILHLSNYGQAIPLLLVAAALIKSAQFPLHGWLIEVMETPTPVSALLHAGIINAGGFLVLRFASIIAPSPHALDILTIAGGLTALFGSVVMLTQTSVKVSLAYSTIAQMGFMMLECGVGAFSAALLHIVAHSLYKAHAFLSSGSVIDLARASWSPNPGGRPHPARLIIAIAAVLGTALAVGALFGATLLTKPGVLALAAVVLLGLIHLVANAADERLNAYVMGRTLALAAAVAIAYFGLQFATEWLLDGSLPATLALRGPLDLSILALVVGGFACVTFFQSMLPHQVQQPRWQALYAHIANGLYVNTLANCLVLKLWPTSPAAFSGAYRGNQAEGAGV